MSIVITSDLIRDLGLVEELEGYSKSSDFCRALLLDLCQNFTINDLAMLLRVSQRTIKRVALGKTKKPNFLLCLRVLALHRIKLGMNHESFNHENNGKRAEIKSDSRFPRTGGAK